MPVWFYLFLLIHEFSFLSFSTSWTLLVVGLPITVSHFQSNFATLDEETGIVISRRADRHFEEEGPILCAALDGMKLPSFPEYEVRVR